MNDQSKPQTAQEWADSAPSTAGDADDICIPCEQIALIEDEGDPHTCNDPRNDPEYQESLHDTQVTQRLANWADEHLGKADKEIFLRLLSHAYEGIRPLGEHANDWALDIC